MIRAAIRAFLFDAGPAVVDLSCQRLPHDAELVARNAARIAEARAALGSHWICALPIVGRREGTAQRHGTGRAVTPQDSTQTVGASEVAPTRDAVASRRSDMTAPDLVTGSAADLHPRLPAWMRAHAADEAADLRRALDALDADDRR